MGGGAQGTLTPRRTVHLEKREQKDVAKNDGHLTKPEQGGLNRPESRISRSIARDKGKNK